jgi:hypothetical protein
MNFLLMAGVMVLMIVFFHGRGHHGPSREHSHHAAKEQGSVARPAEPAPEPRSPAITPSTGSQPDAEPASGPQALETQSLPPVNEP